MKEYKFYDANGYEWRFDGRRVYLVDAEIEMSNNGHDTTNNGYGVNSLEEALDLMELSGEMTREITESPG